MSRPAQRDSGTGYTVTEYFDLVATGVLTPDDQVEVLEGVVVAMSPQSASHAVTVTRVRGVLFAALDGRAVVREEKPLVLSRRSAPEPDVAVVEGELRQYEAAHPTTALLVVEVADSSLAQDRLTKASIYA